MVRGLLAEPVFASKVVLSPRNADTALRLGTGFAELRCEFATKGGLNEQVFTEFQTKAG